MDVRPPVAWLPLRHVDEREFTGARRAANAVLGRVFAAVALILL